jgi:iron complex transport system substrate-binding protein
MNPTLNHPTPSAANHTMPLRVVSLLPSATEIFSALNPDPNHAQLVGRSHECDHPSAVQSLPSLTAPRTVDDASPQACAAIDQAVRTALSSNTSLYTLDEPRLHSLSPDLILTQDLCEVCSIDLASVRRAAAAISPAPRVYSSNPTTFEGVLDDILAIGEAINLPDKAAALVCSLRERIYAASDYTNPFDDGPNVAFLEWTDPLFIGGHWTPQLIERAGARHPLNETRPLREAGAAAGPIGTTLRIAGKSVRVPAQVLAASKPDIIIICPCGLSLPRAITEAKRLAQQPWFQQLPAFKNNRIAIVDGNASFTRPGPRLVDAFEWLVGYINNRPELMPNDFAWSPLTSL